MGFSQRWLQFRLRDLMALVTIVAIFLGLGLPWLLNSRERARDEFCKNKLRQIGMALHAHAAADPSGRFCSGQSDFELVGSPDNYGWIAEAIQLESSLRSRLSCPANPCVASEMVNGLYRGTLGSKSVVAPLQSADGFCGDVAWHNRSAGFCQEFAGTLPRTPERAALISRVVSDKGLATNYTPSWFLTRSLPKLISNPAKTDILVYSTAAKTDPTSPAMTLGGLTIRLVETSPFVSTNIPLLGDGAASGKLAFPMSFGSRLSDGRPDPLHDGTGKFLAYQEAGLVANTTRGPAKWNPATKRLDPLSPGAPLRSQYLAERSGAPLTSLFMQDTRQWQTWHRVGKHAHCNFLMADGSILSVEDQNGDGLLNPGFPVPEGLTSEDYLEIGYQDGAQELDPARVFSGVLLFDFSKVGPE